MPIKFGPHAFSRLYNNQIAKCMVFFKREMAAIERYSQSLALYDGDIQAKNRLANLYAHQNTPYYQPQKALLLFAQLMAQQPQVAAYPFNAGFIEQSLGEHERALHLDRAWYGLALCQIALNQLDAAMVSLKRNTELQPMSPYGWYQLAMTQAHAGLWEDAKATAQHLHTFEPKFARGLKADLQALKPQ
jgi:tetratricopeptide (TPR) repeat protein